MTTQEFSIEFDILYNNLASNTAPPLNEYEKSVFLTKAQSDIVLELYSGRNNLGLAFESSEEARRYLLPLIKFKDVTTLSNSTYDALYKCYKYYIYRPVENDTTWNILRPGLASIKEEVYGVSQEDNINIEVTIPVVPVTQDSLDSILRNPFKQPKGSRRVLRVDSNYAEHSNINGTCVVLYAAIPLDSLKYREWYLAKPSPIILQDKNITGEEGLTIEGEQVTSAGKECALSPVLHRMILDRAVLLAKQAYVGGQAQRAQQE